MKKIVIILLAVLWTASVVAVAVNYTDNVSTDNVSYSDEDSDSLCECDGMDMKCTNPCHSRD
jgi:uncharacterized protein YxeA